MSTRGGESKGKKKKTFSARAQRLLIKQRARGSERGGGKAKGARAASGG